MATGILVVLVTVPSRDEGERISKALLDEKLAACVSIVNGLLSRFLWKGEIDQAEEYLLVVKTKEDLFDPMRDRIRALHSYEVPEILALPVAHGDPDYLSWMDDELLST